MLVIPHLHLLLIFVGDIFKSRRRLKAENLFLRHQLNIALRRAPHRLRLRGSDRALLVWITRIWRSLLDLSQVVKPETILRWHRSGFRAFWRWKSRNRVGRPKVDRELRDLIRRMSRENPLWGCSEPRKSDRFWLEFSAVIPRLGGAESDEGIEIFGRPEGVHSQAGC